MMRIVLLLLITCSLLNAQYEGPIPAPTSGYGALGPHSVTKMDIPNNHFLQKPISVYYPTDATTSVPIICFLHGFGANDTTTYQETLRHIASWGYAAVFVPYKTTNVDSEERYQTMYDGFKRAALLLPNIVDTKRVGFYGHSFGGGAIPAISYQLFTEDGWGSEGKFIFCNAPWYALEMPQETLDQFPQDCNMITLVHDEDYVNDLRMAMDIFENIPIDDEQKDFMISYSDTVGGYEYHSWHFLPAQGNRAGLDAFNALDYVVTFRLLHSLSEYTFSGDMATYEVALGGGSAAQITTHPDLKDLYSTDDPRPIYPNSTYASPCEHQNNTRVDYCPVQISSDTDIALTSREVELYPYPHTDQFQMMGNLSLYDIQILDQSETLYQQIIPSGSTHTIDLNTLPDDLYFIKMTNKNISDVSVQLILKSE